MMLCDELKYEKLGDMMPFYPRSTLVIRKQFVDAAIDELKREHHKERHEYIDWVNRLQKEYAELKEVYKDSVDVKVKIWERCKKAEDEIRRQKRALWIARANRALEKIAWFKLWNASISTMNPEDGARQEFDKWKKALGKCLAKAKEYK